MTKLPQNKITYLGALTLAAVINWSIPPIARVNEMLRVLRYESGTIQISQSTIEQKVLSHDASPLNYLNAATEVVGVVYDPENKIRCVEYGRAIFDTYQKLVILNGRKDLTDKIRVCADMKRMNGHLWIEYKEGDTILPYQFYPTSEQGSVGVRTMWGKKIPYPTPDSLTRWSGLIGVLLSEE